jgi:hypothetical protein
MKEIKYDYVIQNGVAYLKFLLLKSVIFDVLN